MHNSPLCKLPDDGLVKPKHVGAFIIYFNVNFNILKQINCALVGLIKDWITQAHLRDEGNFYILCHYHKHQWTSSERSLPEPRYHISDELSYLPMKKG